MINFKVLLLLVLMASSSSLFAGGVIVSVERTDQLGTDQTIISGTDDIDAMTFTITNDGEDAIIIASIIINKEGTASPPTAAIFVEGTQQGSARILTDLAVSFEVDLDIPPFSSKEFELVIDLDDNFVPSNLLLLVTGIEAVNVEINEDIPVFIINPPIHPISDINRLESPLFKIRLKQGVPIATLILLLE